jgi:hypothetical protein
MLLSNESDRWARMDQRLSVKPNFGADAMTSLEILPPSENIERLPRIDVLAADIRRLLKHEREHAIEIGRKLIEAKADLQHGAWRPWLRTNFAWTEKTAQRRMQLTRAAQRLDAAYDLKPTELSYLPMETVVLLASAPCNLRDDVAGSIRAGHRPSDEDIRQIIFKNYQPKSTAGNVDKDALSEHLDAQRPDALAEAHAAIEILVSDLTPDRLEAFKAHHRRAGPAFDYELHGQQ